MRKVREYERTIICKECNQPFTYRSTGTVPRSFCDTCRRVRASRAAQVKYKDTVKFTRLKVTVFCEEDCANQCAFYKHAKRGTGGRWVYEKCRRVCRGVPIQLEE